MKLTLLLVIAINVAAQAQNAARNFAVDVAASHIYVITHRTGVLSFLGHQHAVLAQQWTPDVCWDTASHAASRARFAVDVGTLTIDADSARRIAGLGRGPSAGQRAQIHDKMMRALEPAAHPSFTFVSDSVQPRAGGLTLFGNLNIRGRPRDVAIPVDVVASSGGTSLSGKVTIRQTWFGIKPESIAGVVKVKDEVDLHVRLKGTITDTPCR